MIKCKGIMHLKYVSYKTLSVMKQACAPNTLGNEDRRVPRAQWPIQSSRKL